MNRIRLDQSFWILFGILVILSCRTMHSNDQGSTLDVEHEIDTIRVASYNIAMYGSDEDDVLHNLQDSELPIQYKNIASIIKVVRPDVLVLMEIDYDSTQIIIDLFNGLLSDSAGNLEILDYPYRYQIPSNTGEISKVDMNGDGLINIPQDAYGYGKYAGQYASAIMSKYPLDLERSRSFKKFLWKNMPDASLPINADGSDYYSTEILADFRLSSKNHIDIPIMMKNDKIVHALIAHPTPPVFDGVEDRNGKRNHDEIKLWADYISGEDYLTDDNGLRGGLTEDTSFIIFGDLNADPLDGDSYQSAINQLLEHPKVNTEIAIGSKIPSSNGGKENILKSKRIGNGTYHTSHFGLRIDYVLPSQDIQVIDSGVFWPTKEEKYASIVAKKVSSDHLLVWADIVL